MSANPHYAQAAKFRALAQVLPTRAETVVRKVAIDSRADAQALAPVDTGNLRNSITAGPAPEHGGTTIAYEVVARTNYALFVENGTSRMEPQPFMGPALERNAPIFKQAIQQIGDMT